MHKEKEEISYSVVIPVYNEQENIRPLYESLDAALNELDQPAEMIFVDDGSTDDSYLRLCELTAKDPRVRVLRFRRNFGQTAAMTAGFDYSRGRIIIPMDGDLQNDPADIKSLLAKIEEGYDVVSGWRRHRQEPFFTRRLPSITANWLISKISGVKLHDYGCTLKAYRSEVLGPVRLYGEMHRFIPIYASWNGARITEIPVSHNARKFGRSKYGIERTFKVILDLIVVSFYARYSQKPIYIFGGFGLLSIVGALLAGIFALYLKFFVGKSFVETPLPLLTVLLTIMGVMSILMGLLAEMTMRTYHESQQKPTYIIKEIVEGKQPACAESADT